MKNHAALGLFALAAISVTVEYTAFASEGVDAVGGPTFLVEMPRGYRDLSLISVSRLTAGDGRKQLRAELGNDVAMKAYRAGTLPFPDGAIIAALHWKEVPSEENTKVLAKGFPGASYPIFRSCVGRECAIHGQGFKEICGHRQLGFR